jgi:hypothetical protein
MKMLGLVAATWAVGTAAPAAALSGPIEPASAGKLQCYSPNLATKTCQSLASYEAGPDGAIVNPATVLISAAPAITMRTVSPVIIKADKVCGVLHAEEIAAAEFTIGEKPATGPQTGLLRQKVAEGQRAFLGHEICTAYIPAGDVLLAKASIDGVAQPKLDQKMIWVSPSDGFKVKP